MDRPEFMRLPFKILPSEVIEHYNLKGNVNDGRLYVKITHGMYCLPHAGLIANKQLKQRLGKAGYYEC